MIRIARSFVLATCTLAVSAPALVGCAERPGKKAKDDKKDDKKKGNAKAKDDKAKDDKAKDDKAKGDEKKPE